MSNLKHNGRGDFSKGHGNEHHIGIDMGGDFILHDTC